MVFKGPEADLPRSTINVFAVVGSHCDKSAICLCENVRLCLWRRNLTHSSLNPSQRGENKNAAIQRSANFFAEEKVEQSLRHSEQRGRFGFIAKKVFQKSTLIQEKKRAGLQSKTV